MAMVLYCPSRILQLYTLYILHYGIRIDRTEFEIYNELIVKLSFVEHNPGVEYYSM